MAATMTDEARAGEETREREETNCRGEIGAVRETRGTASKKRRPEEGEEDFLAFLLVPIRIPKPIKKQHASNS